MEHYLDGKIDECTFRDKYYRLYACFIKDFPVLFGQNRNFTIKYVIHTKH